MNEQSSSDITVEVPANHTFWMHSFDLSETSPRLPTFSIVNDTDNSDVYIIGDTNNAVVGKLFLCVCVWMHVVCIL